MTREDETSDPGNVVQVQLAPEAVPDLEKMRRHFFAASSCGICGKASIDSVRSRTLLTPNPDFCFDPEILVALPDALRASQAVSGRTGGDCMPRRYLAHRVSCLCFAKISEGTTRWTR
jgi:FdhD protein